jgi:O-succinylhomoserine sulfhydrylase
MTLGGGLVSFELHGGADRCKNFINNVEMISHTSNLGDSRTSITHPASTTHSKLTSEERERVNITDGLIRLSAGLEHIDDIIIDLQKAIDKSK